jgi:glucose/arabinose dehydrogenase
VGDVGGSQLEEIDIVQKGLNYGWNIMEGTSPFLGGTTTGLQLPVYEYTHSLGNAVVGGYVYHGQALPQLSGAYVYGDYGSGRIWALTLNSSGQVASNVELCHSNLTISSFGLNQNGEIYICALNDGKIYQLTAQEIPELSGVAFRMLAVVFIVGAILVIQGKIRRSC